MNNIKIRSSFKIILIQTNGYENLFELYKLLYKIKISPKKTNKQFRFNKL